MQAWLSRLSPGTSALLAAGAIAVATASAVVPAASAASGQVIAPGQVTATGRAFRAGTVRLRECGTRPRTFCGGLAVPLDYSSPASPRIRISFRWLPATRHPQGTILAVEGGPGYASTGSEPEYLAMIGGLA